MANETKVVLSYGMGVESTAILLRWLKDPSSRNFDLKDLVVLTSMVGNEWGSTISDVEAHILPLLREHGVRFVQVARAASEQAAGFALLDDSTSPTALHAAGAFKLTDELLPAATVPQFAKGKRLCSIKMKGWPLDAWIHQEMAGAEYRHVIGFNAGEMERVERDCSYSTVQRHSEYPLVDWAWDRDACIAFIRETLGVEWKKSSCTFCPFSSGKEGVMARYAQEPEAAVEALKLETVALSINPRQSLYSGKTLRSCLDKAGQTEPAAQVDAWMNASEWAVYRVRRVFYGVARANRQVAKLATGTRAEMESKLFEAGEVDFSAGFFRLSVTTLDKSVYPAIEETWVAAPAVAANKAVKGWDARWAKANKSVTLRAAWVARKARKAAAVALAA